MKRFISVLIVLAMAVSMFAMSGCGKKYDGEISVYNFGEYIDDETWKMFQEQYNIKVNYKTYETCESMYSVLKTGGASYDVIITSDYMIARLIDEGMLEKLDHSNIPNYSLLGDAYKGAEYDPTDEYSAVYMWGTVGLIYNGAEITEDLDSWGALFDEKYAGQILMFESSRDSMAIALLYLGYSVNTTDQGELQEAYELLKDQSSIIQGYFQDQMYDKLEGGEALLGAYYAGDYLCMLENNPDLKFVVPKEGANKFYDAMCIPAGCENKEAAEKFINFMCSTDIALMNMEETGYASPNTEACEIYGEELDEYAYNIMFPSDEVMNRCQTYTNLPQDTLELYDSYWVQLKS